MLIVISPAKTMDFESRLPTKKYTEAKFLDQSQQLIKIMQGYSSEDITELMGVSAKIAELNQQRFSDWRLPLTPDNARPAIFAFKGDVYEGLQALTMNTVDINFAQKHLRMLSGLYGLLKPLDLMLAYRLEMGVRLKNPRGTNLYQYWGEQITEALNEELRAQKSQLLINLASNEYFKAVKPALLDADIITPQFKDWKNGEYKMISFFAKRARGTMSRYIISHKIKKADQLKDFATEGYEYNASMSKGNNWVFTRKLVAAA